MGAIAKILGIKAASGGPNISDDGTFAVMPWWLGALAQMGVNTTSGKAVTTDNALGIVSVYACVRVLAESVASLPLIVYRRLPGGGKERATDHPLYSVLHDSPNPEMTSFVWRETVMTHLTTWGNSYNEIAFDQAGRMQLWPLPPSRIEVKLENGRRVYDYIQNSGNRQRLADGTMFHIPGLSYNGLIGLSPIALHREALGLYQALQDFGASTMRNMARPATVLSHPKNLSEGAIQRLGKQMEEMRGSGNAGKTVVLEEGLAITPIGIPPDDAQYIEGRKFQRQEVCAMFRVPPHKIADLERATFSNIEHQAIEFVTDSLRPWLVRLEQQVKADLMFGEDDVFAEHLIDGLLRGDGESRAKKLQIERQMGVINADDWNEIENRNPLPDELGQTYWMPVNYKAAVPPNEAEPETPEPPTNGNGAFPIDDLERVA